MFEPLVAALDDIELRTGGKENEKLQLLNAKLRGLILGYDTRWRKQFLGWQILDVERTITSDLWNPATEAKSRTFSVAGKIDLLASIDGERVLIDHKTCSEDIADPMSSYWKQLVVEGQLSHYMLLLWLNGEKVDRAQWDVMRKPSISPRQITKTEMAALVATRQWHSYQIEDEEIEQAQATGRETLRLYEARLAWDCSSHRPEWYFAKRTIPRLEAEIAEYAGELWDLGQELVQIRRTQRHVRNSGACMRYGSPCEYLSLCSGVDTPESDRWRRLPNVHEELPELAGDGRDVLTNSRIRSFQTCRRLHYYEYEAGITSSEEERESLVFGTLWHSALAAYFERLKETQNGNA